MSQQEMLIQLDAVWRKISKKIRADASTFQEMGEDEKEFAPELQALDDLLAAHKNEKSEAVAQIISAKATLYGMIHRPDLHKKLIDQLIQDYPGTFQAKVEAAAVAGDALAAEDRLRHQLVGQPAPDFRAEDLEGKPHLLAAYRGKVLFIDFWSTECEPCMAEMPNIAKVYGQYRNQGFEVLGVDEAQEDNGSKLAAFVKEQNLPWPECIDAFALGAIFHVGAYPSSYLIGRDGKIIGVDLTGKDLDAAVARALAAK